MKSLSDFLVAARKQGVVVGGKFPDELVDYMPTIGPIVDSVQNSIATTLLTTAETVVATLSGVTTFQDTGRVLLLGIARLTTGTSTTTVTPRFRRGSLTGTVLGNANAIAIASAVPGPDNYEHWAVWTPGEVVNESVVLTLAQAGAAANGSCLDAFILALIGH